MRGEATPVGNLRRTEFARLDAAGVAYLDYGGAAPYGDSQLRAHFARLARGVFGNPHSMHASSRESHANRQRGAADGARFPRRRRRLRRRLHGERQRGDPARRGGIPVLFSGAARAQRRQPQLGERRPRVHAAGWRAGCLSAARHRAYASTIRPRGSRHLDGRGLFAFPAQSNFSGVRHPLSLVPRGPGTRPPRAPRRGRIRTVARPSACAPARLTSSRCRFTRCSATRLASARSWPRREALAELRRPWFAGGTVEFVSVELGRHRLHHWSRRV